MKHHDFESHDSPPKLWARRHLHGKTQYLLTGEKQLLESIFVRAPLAKLLNEICNALDRQIGNVVSLISVRGEEEGDLAAIDRIAALFGLYAFCSEALVGEDGEGLGSLEMYCCVPRRPSTGEFQLIERAKCLATMAIQIDDDADDPVPGDARRNRLLQRRALDWPSP